MSERTDHALTDPDRDTLPGFIAIEGPIGVGKTSLARRLAATLNYDTLLESVEDNPFLERFYRDPAANALPTQLHFLFQRTRQIQQLRQGDMFNPLRVADFLLDKDPLFARVTLDDEEFRLYQQVYEQLTVNKPIPDLVIYLQAPPEVLLARIHKRGVAAERTISADYLRRLNEAYTQLFHYYDEAPLLIVNTRDINLADRDSDYRLFVDYLRTVKSGRHYYNPQYHYSPQYHPSS
ncbi:MAG TPA: deoxynucleoside kinase [Porticoccaceae bacterium]|nr:deoxynucleoside kinase [Porticoccaceae bacterium]